LKQKNGRWENGRHKTGRGVELRPPKQKWEEEVSGGPTGAARWQIFKPKNANLGKF
jgi:hypothetical protein